jgi:hypothetical protein
MVKHTITRVSKAKQLRDNTEQVQGLSP